MVRCQSLEKCWQKQPGDEKPAPAVDVNEAVNAAVAEAKKTFVSADDVSYAAMQQFVTNGSGVAGDKVKSVVTSALDDATKNFVTSDNPDFTEMKKLLPPK